MSQKNKTLSDALTEEHLSKKKKKNDNEVEWLHEGHLTPPNSTSWVFLFFTFDVDVHPTDAQCVLCGACIKYISGGKCSATPLDDHVSIIPQGYPQFQDSYINQTTISYGEDQ